MLEGTRAMSDAEQHEPSSQLDPESLRAAFPDWRLGGAPGNWFAVRGGLEATSGPRSLLRRCLSASTLSALADKLCLQEHLDGLSDHDLADTIELVVSELVTNA